MPQIYTKYGDEGETSLLYGGRVSKTDPRCEAYGTVDEAISALGIARTQVESTELKSMIKKIQRDLFKVGAELATSVSDYHKLQSNFSVITEEMVAELEDHIDTLNDSMTLPSAFIVPGSSIGSAALDLSRTIMRRAERKVVTLKHGQLLANDKVLKYINRLADLLFIMARYEDKDIPFDTVTDQKS